MCARLHQHLAFVGFRADRNDVVGAGGVPAGLASERIKTAREPGSAEDTAGPEGYDPTDRASAAAYITERHAAGEVGTGLLFATEDVPDLHELSRTTSEPLASRR